MACSGSLVAAAPADVRAEVVTLLGRLEASGCEFSRNGSWHTGREAKAHLQRKLDYLERKGTLSSSEQFIELAASTSSSSGKPYQVRCGNGSATSSKQWLTEELAKVRSKTSSR